jgi:DNA invertase Pin-like site-specific DNA recombinase
MIMEQIKEAEAGFRSLTEAIDTTTAPGRMMMQMVGAFAEFERAILRERRKAGLDAAASVAASEGDGRNLGLISKMKLLRW